MSDLQGRIALVTGASAGIGRAAALQLAEAGARVFAAARRLDRLEELAAEGRLMGWRIEPLQLDVTDEASLAAAVERIAAATGGYGLDILVNNAGYGQMGPLEEVPLDAWRKQFETNVFGMVAAIQAFLPAMRARRSGRIINISSLGGRLTMPFASAYTASKFAVEAISDTLRVELDPWNIKVVVVEPGPILTEFGSTVKDYLAERRSVYPQAADFLQIFAQTEGASAPSVVGRTIANVAAVARPRARYVSPWFFGPLLRIVELLPAAVIDSALKISIGLIRKRFGPAPQPGASEAAGHA